MKITIHDTARRPWGYETLITATDTTDGEIYNQCIVTGTIPKTEAEIITLAEAQVNGIIARKAAKEEPEMTYTKTEIEQLLKEKELLANDESLDDLQSKDEILADSEKEAVK